MKRAPLFLSLLLLIGCAGQQAASRPLVHSTRASLGIVTSAPSVELAAELGLPFKTRQQCRVVESVSEPAAGAGIRRGDVLFAVGDVDLYSQDDLDDVLRVSRPGEEVVLAVKRKEEEVRKIKVKLGAEAAEEPQGIAWRYASFANLPRALAEARATKKNVLVGLSGAET